MAINNKPLGTPGNTPALTPNEQVSPKLVDHNTTEESFQEGIYDVAIQVDRTQQDIGYTDDISMRAGREARTLDDRLDTLEDILGISNDDQGTQSAASASIDIGGALADTGNPALSGTLAAPQINPLAVMTANIADSAVTTDKIMDGTIVSGDLNAAAGVTRTQLESGIQTFAVSTGDNTAAAQELGSDISIPLFAEDQDGVVDAPTSAEATTATGAATDSLYVLGSDNNWHQLSWFTQNGTLIPSSSINYTTTSHSISAAIPMGTSFAEYIAAGATRVEGGSEFGVENGDIITVTDTTPTPDQTAAFVYIGGTSLGAGADGTTDQFVQIGLAESFGFATNGGVEFATGTRNLQLSNVQETSFNFRGTNTHSGSNTFSGSSTFNGTLRTNNLAELGANTNASIRMLGRVTSSVVPQANNTHDLGTSSLMWNNVYANTLHAPVTDSNIAAGALTENRISPGTAGQLLTTMGASGSEVSMWVDPPTGLEIYDGLRSGEGTDLPDPTAIFVGTVVSLNRNTTSFDAGVYRAAAIANQAMDGSATDIADITWAQLGTIGVILSKDRLSSVANQTSYVTSFAIPSAHLITIDGLVLVESVDYTRKATGLGFDLTTAVAAGKDIEVLRYADMAALGTGEVSPSVLSSGTLPSGITVPAGQVDGTVNAATSATTAASSSFTIGGWTLGVDSSGHLTFTHGGTLRARLDTNGEFHTTEDITAFDNL